MPSSSRGVQPVAVTVVAVCDVEDRRPCRDYRAAECSELTLEEIKCCTASDHPDDDREGFCVMQQRCN